LARWLKPKESLKTSSEKKPIQALAALHESASLRAVTGALLRPGGFRLTERGISFCGFPRLARIIDVREKHHFKALGLELSESLLRENSQMECYPLALARAEELPISHGVCDGILCECVLSLVFEPELALAEFARVLRPGGYLIMSDLYDRGRKNTATTCSGGGMSALRTHSAIESLVADAEFECLVWEDHTKYLKELAAQMILSHGSFTDSCDFFADSGSGCTGSSALMRYPGPGYFLMVAQKSDRG
jgi:arsenite methyltransferase